MSYCGRYESPLGELLIRVDAEADAVTGVLFADEPGAAALQLRCDVTAFQPQAFTRACNWFDAYFSAVPGTSDELPSLPRLALHGSPFQLRVWEVLRTIEFGQTVTYGQIAQILAAQTPGKRVAAQAVGGAVGRNPVAIIVPCHRVLGASRQLTGYAGGLARKQALLDLEGVTYRF